MIALLYLLFFTVILDFVTVDTLSGLPYHRKPGGQHELACLIDLIISKIYINLCSVLLDLGPWISPPPHLTSKLRSLKGKCRNHLTIYLIDLILGCKF